MLTFVLDLVLYNFLFSTKLYLMLNKKKVRKFKMAQQFPSKLNYFNLKSHFMDFQYNFFSHEKNK